MRWKHVFDPAFVAEPYWWETARPEDASPGDLPSTLDVLVIGAGYAGLNAALELAEHGREAGVVDAGPLGGGASSRNAGAVDGAATSLARADSVPEVLLAEGTRALEFVEELIEARSIRCGYERSGRFVAAWAPAHLERLRVLANRLNAHRPGDAEVLPPDRQWEEIGSAAYHGGLLVRGAGRLHPVLYLRGLLDACVGAGARLWSATEVRTVAGGPGEWRVSTSRGELRAREIIVATNGYTGAFSPELRRRLAPAVSHMIATEPLPPELARTLVPNGRTVSETARVPFHCRLSPDGSRVLFGGQVHALAIPPETAAAALHARLLARYPQLRGARITHAWSGMLALTRDHLPHAGRARGLYYCVGCNGSGIASLSYLGHVVAREVLSTPVASALWQRRFAPLPCYRGRPWFLPLMHRCLRARDRLERRRGA